MDFYAWLERFFRAAAWPMELMRPYSAPHVALSAAGILFAWFAARKFAARRGSDSQPCPTYTNRILFFCGLLLAFMELYKQGFLYFIVNGRRYDWWYFPFQLCSVPMYLCLILRFLPSQRGARVIMTFLRAYSLLGGFLALAVPPGLMHPYWVLTLHGFFWHFILIFIGFFCAMCGGCDDSVRGFFATLPLFFFCCAIAFLINVITGPGANADLFYISPYHPSSQPVFHWISLRLGILPSVLLYLSSVLCGGFLVHTLCKITGKR